MSQSQTVRTGAALQIYISKGVRRYGPYSIEELRQQLDADAFRPGDFASIDDGRTWAPISAVPGIGPTSFAVEIDQAKNLLVIRYHGRVTALDAERCAEEVRVALPKMHPRYLTRRIFLKLGIRWYVFQEKLGFRR